MTPNLVKEYEAYCQWEYDLIIDFPKSRNVECIQEGINRILGAGQLSLKLVRIANGGVCTKTDQEQDEISDIYTKFKKMFKNLLTNE